MAMSRSVVASSTEELSPSSLSIFRSFFVYKKGLTRIIAMTKDEAVIPKEKIIGCGVLGNPTFELRKIAQATIDPNAPIFKNRIIFLSLIVLET